MSRQLEADAIGVCANVPYTANSPRFDICALCGPYRLRVEKPISLVCSHNLVSLKAYLDGNEQLKYRCMSRSMYVSMTEFFHRFFFIFLFEIEIIFFFFIIDKYK